jgi:parvulin-like peptidyl-prolyl isomerase
MTGRGTDVSVSKLLREPLVHFLVLGLLLFGLYALVAPASRGDSIVISRGRVDAIISQYKATWNRTPTADELQALVEAEVRSEILYREGVAQGLDRDDAVIQRRVRQKYELISEEDAAGAPPTDADLQAWLTAHPKAFERPPVVTFDQILIPVDGGDAAVEARIAAAQAALAAGKSPASLGETSMLPAHVEATPLDLVGRDFGEVFAAALAKAPVGAWGPPVVSGYGAHLVRVTARTPAALPALADIRPQVAREWENDRREKANEARYAELRRRYDVKIETP